MNRLLTYTGSLAFGITSFFGCAANSKGEYRDHVINKNGSVVQYVGTNIALNHKELEQKSNDDYIVKEIGDFFTSLPEDKEKLRALVEKQRPKFMLLLEDIVEGTLTELTGEEVDYNSPINKVMEPIVQIAKRKGDEVVYNGELDYINLTPTQKLAFGYLLTHFGPENADRFDRTDNDIVKFTNLLNAYLFAGDSDQSDNILKQLRAVEKKIYVTYGIPPETVEENDKLYDATVWNPGGLSDFSFPYRVIVLPLKYGNWNMETILRTYFHEAGHQLISERFNLCNGIDFLLWPSEEELTLQENAANVIADKALEYFKETRLQNIGTEWLEWNFLRQEYRLLSDQQKKFRNLFANPREDNAANDAINKRYRSKKEKLALLMEKYGFSNFLELASELEEFEELENCVKAAENDESFEEVLAIAD